MSLVALHAFLRWVVLAILGAAVAAGLAGLAHPVPRAGVRWAFLGAVAAMDLQAALGVVIWLGQSAWASHGPFTAWVHPAAMAVALVLVHVGAARVGRAGRRDLLLGLAAASGAALLVVVGVPGGWLER